MTHPYRFLVLAALTFAACDDKGTDTDVDTDPDTFDAGTDADTEADTEPDTEADTEADTEPDTDAPINLVTNPGFEATPGFADWAIFPGDLSNREITTTARTGAAAASLYARADGNGGETPVYQQVQSTEGTCFTMRGWVYAPSIEPLANTEAWLSLKFFTADFGGFSAQESARITATTTQDEWTQLTVIGEVPTGFVNVQAALELWECPLSRRGCASDGAVYFDDIQFFESPDACTAR